METWVMTFLRKKTNELFRFLFSTFYSGIETDPFSIYFYLGENAGSTH
jgi:hypothetical protein